MAPCQYHHDTITQYQLQCFSSRHSSSWQSVMGVLHAVSLLVAFCVLITHCALFNDSILKKTDIYQAHISVVYDLLAKSGCSVDYKQLKREDLMQDRLNHLETTKQVYRKLLKKLTECNHTGDSSSDFYWNDSFVNHWTNNNISCTSRVSASSKSYRVLEKTRRRIWKIASFSTKLWMRLPC